MECKIKLSHDEGHGFGIRKNHPTETFRLYDVTPTIYKLFCDWLINLRRLGQRTAGRVEVQKYSGPHQQ